jgi:hypothetical protein
MLFAGLQCTKAVRLQRLCLASSLMRVQLLIFPVIVLLGCSGSAAADYKDDIGYARLLDELGVSNIPNGSGVPVTQAEAENTTTSAYLPDDTDNQFTDKTITDKSKDTTDLSSSHATSVGRSFYGNSSSIAPAIDKINAYNANDWLQFDYLRFNGSGNRQPLVLPDRIANHSWIGSYDNLAADSNVLRRTDWVVETDEFIQCVGIKNNSSVNRSLLSGAYNVIAVGKSDGVNGFGTSQLDNDYVTGRTRPEMVAPMTSSSGATPVVAAAAAFLVELGRNPGLSADLSVISTTNRKGDTIFNAERSEVIKAALMAGADRATNNGSVANLSDYRVDAAHQTVNGLDKRFGAGQVNIYNSYHIIAAGEQNSDEDDGSSGSGEVGSSGFDYDPYFGGGGGSNSTASYYFSTGISETELSATLAWNININGGNLNSFSGSATRYNLDLHLYDVTGGGEVLLKSSSSTIDNTETIWEILDAGRDYRLKVTGQGSFNWDFSLAWKLTDLVDLIDTDSDGTPNILDVDDDNDGLLDGDEVTSGTDPLDVDTDSDGFEDGMEVTYGSDPLDDLDTPTGNDVNNGDVNGDTRVNVADVLLAMRIALGELEPTPEQLVRADMVPDGQVNAGDLLRIQQLVLGL